MYQLNHSWSFLYEDTSAHQSQMFQSIIVMQVIHIFYQFSLWTPSINSIFFLNCGFHTEQQYSKWGLTRHFYKEINVDPDLSVKFLFFNSNCHPGPGRAGFWAAPLLRDVQQPRPQNSASITEFMHNNLLRIRTFHDERKLYHV